MKIITLIKFESLAVLDCDFDVHSIIGKNTNSNLKIVTALLLMCVAETDYMCVLYMETLQYEGKNESNRISLFLCAV